MIKIIKEVLTLIILVIQIIKSIPMKKGFFKTAFTILQFLVEEWDVIYPLIKELVDEIKEQKQKQTLQK